MQYNHGGNFENKSDITLINCSRIRMWMVLRKHKLSYVCYLKKMIVANICQSTCLERV